MRLQRTAASKETTAITVAAVACIVSVTSLTWIMTRQHRKQQRRRRSLQQPPRDPTENPNIILSLIRKRRSIFPKQYTGKPISKQVIADMLEAARWAPTHHLTQPWHFIVMESETARAQLGHYLADQYKANAMADDNKNSFVESKCDKKFNNCLRTSHILAICLRTTGRNPAVEDLCSVAMAVQNMHLVASAHGVGAYWSSSGMYERPKPKWNLEMKNPAALRELLDFPEDDEHSRYLCLGWLFVGDFDSEHRAWPEGRRNLCSVEVR